MSLKPILHVFETLKEAFNKYFLSKCEQETLRVVTMAMICSILAAL